MSSSEALSLMLTFGSFLIALLTFVVLLIEKFTKKIAIHML